MTNKQINDLYNGISNLKGKKLPIGVSFVLSRNSKLLKEINEDIESARIGIIEQYCTKGADGDPIIEENGDVHIPRENVDSFNNDMDELFNRNIDVTLEKLSMKDIEKCDLEKYDPLTLEEFEILEQLINNCNNEGDGVDD